ncbi:MAG: hypothetical protein ACE37F_19270 [Nannocystaceae bacterium]|nr:hypothetical protein [bacterium]
MGSFITPTGGCALPDGVYGHCSMCAVEQQDCAQGESCAAWANDGGDVWNASRCAPLPDDPAQRGDPCTVEGSAVSGIDTCDAGLICWNVDPETLTGACIDFCDAAYSCEVEGETCSVYNDGAMPLCLPSCNPLEDECGEGNGCYPDSQGTFVCIREGENLYLSGDAFHPHCPAGSFLHEDACVAFCDVTDDLACDEGESCEPYYAMASTPPIGLEDVGYCLPAGG